MEPKAVTALQQTLASSSSVISKTFGSTLLQAASEPRLCARRGSWSPAHLLTARSVSCAANRPRVTECCTISHSSQRLQQTVFNLPYSVR